MEKAENLVVRVVGSMADYQNSKIVQARNMRA
jgi:hypothetical protein